MAEQPYRFAAPWVERGSASGVVAGATGRHGGCSAGRYGFNNLALHVGDDVAAVQRNRDELQVGLGARRIQWLQQVHGSECVRSSLQTADSEPQADAVWTDDAGLALAILTADCVPVLLRDDRSTCIGAAHAGWQGLHQGVIAQLVEAMPVPAARLEAWIGPCISAMCYEVGEDVWSVFASGYAQALSVHPTDQAKRQLDLEQVARLQLQAAGVGAVSASGICTYQQRDYYSHRRAVHEGQAPTGRFASVIMLGG